jgi:CSLREA domain-containing protein
MAMLLVSPLAQAAVITVNSTADNLTAGNGLCTLREAIINAISDLDATAGDCTAGTAAPDTINVPPGTYRMSITGAGENASLTGDFDLFGNLTIMGLGGVPTIQGPTSDRIFDVQAGAAQIITLQDLILKGGNATNGGGDDDGGAIRLTTSNSLTLTRVLITENDADDNGGGIFCSPCASLVITDSTFTKNSADDDNSVVGDGGAIFLFDAATATISDSIFGDVSGGTRATDQNTAQNGGAVAISGNSTLTTSGSTFGVNEANNNGGAIHDTKTTSTTTIVNTTISGNTANVDGGGIFIDDSSGATPSVLLVNNTITNNTADDDNNGTGDGGGLLQDTGDIDMENNIVVGNFDSSSSPDCDGTFTSLGQNFIGANDGCSGSFAAGFPNGTGDFVGTEAAPLDAKLEDLAVVPPGLPPVHIPQGDSPVIDEGDNAACAAAPVNNLDQRGVARPQQFDGVNSCDIGAVELRRFEQFATTQSIRVSSGFNVPFHCGQERVTFRNNGDKVDSIELNETIVSIVFPESRISTRPSTRDQAQIVQSATLNDPANFQTAGVMSAFVLATLNPGKTYRITCRDIQRQPVTFNVDGTIAMTIEDTQSASSEFFQGVLAIQSTKTIEVSAKKIKRIWIGVPDGGVGVNYTNGEHVVAHLTFESSRISGSRLVDLFVSKTGLPTTSASMQQLSEYTRELSQPRFGHLAMFGNRSLKFQANGIPATQLDVQVFGLNGREVFSDSARGNALQWNLRDSRGRPVANGVYLYVITVRGPDGQVIRSGVKKLIVLR